jgi:integrase
MLETNVARDVAVPVKSSRLVRSLSLDEVGRVIAAAEQNKHLMHGQLYEFIHVALFTGFRRSELRTLTWDDINFDTRRIIVQSKQIDGEPDFTPKSGSARYKSVPDKLMPLLSEMTRSGRFVFGGDKPYHIDSISQVVRLLMRRAGLVGVSLHHCRHTYGSWLLKRTGDLSLVQGEMGHMDLSTTKRYMHTVEDLNDPARAFDYE